MTRSVAFNLPFPPATGNRLYVNRRGGGKALNPVVLSYYTTVKLYTPRDLSRRPLKGPLLMAAALVPPSSHRRDLDNCEKVFQDAITKASIWGDDSQVIAKATTWFRPEGRGRIHVELIELGDEFEAPSINKAGVVIGGEEPPPNRPHLSVCDQIKHAIDAGVAECRLKQHTACHISWPALKTRRPRKKPPGKSRKASGNANYSRSMRSRRHRD